MPTIGQFEFFFGGPARVVWSAGLERADSLRLDFARKRGGALFGFRFTAMALGMLIAS